VYEKAQVLNVRSILEMVGGGENHPPPARGVRKEGRYESMETRSDRDEKANENEECGENVEESYGWAVKKRTRNDKRQNIANNRNPSKGHLSGEGGFKKSTKFHGEKSLQEPPHPTFKRCCLQDAQGKRHKASKTKLLFGGEGS